MNLISIFGVIAGIIHVVFFVVEAFLWTKPSVWRAFGGASQEEADIQQFALMNQGWYNLFLALGAFWGVVRHNAGESTLLWYSMLFMVGAGLVLVIARPKLVRGFLLQALAPAIAIAGLVFA